MVKFANRMSTSQSFSPLMYNATTDKQQNAYQQFRCQSLYKICKVSASSQTVLIAKEYRHLNKVVAGKMLKLLGPKLRCWPRQMLQGDNPTRMHLHLSLCHLTAKTPGCSPQHLKRRIPSSSQAQPPGTLTIHHRYPHLKGPFPYFDRTWMVEWSVLTRCSPPELGPREI